MIPYELILANKFKKKREEYLVIFKSKNNNS